jgi:predicted permease
MSICRALRLYNRLLLVLPADFRRRNGAELELVFGEALCDARQARTPTFRHWFAAILDLIQLAVTHRWYHFSERRRRRSLPSGALNGPSPQKESEMFRALIHDIWTTLRSFRKAPAFVAVAVLTIGLGIGATTLVFSVVHGVLLQPLPYHDADRIVNVWNHLVEERQYLPVVHPADFRDYQAMSETFEDLAAASGSGQVGLTGVLTGDGPPVRIDLSPVTHNFFSLLGIDPLLGRHFAEEEEEFQGPAVAILSHELWTARFGRDENIIGNSIQIDGRAFEVVGVMPRGFRLLLPEEAFLLKHSDIWVPLQTNYARLPPRNWTLFTVFGRLKDDVTLAEAQAEMDRIAEELRATHPAHATSGMEIHLVPLRQDIVKKARPTLLILFGAVGFVLLIACANVAHLLLLRGTARQRELAVRSALGASRRAIVRQVFVESVVLAFLGAALGLLITSAGLQLLTVLQPPNLPRLTELGVSGPILGFAVVVAAFTSVVFGLAPAYYASRANVTDLLKEGGRSGGTVGAMRVRNALVIGEVAFSLVLLVGTGLMLRSFLALEDVDPGFDADRALTFGISLPRGEYQQRAEAQAFYDELFTRLAALPSVEAVGAANKLPLTGTIGLWPYAYDDETARDYTLSADMKTVSAGHFTAMGTRLLAGRFFDSQDVPGSPLVVIVDEMLATRAWPDEDPIGQELLIGPNQTPFTVAGVTEHIRAYDLKADVREQLYVCFGQVGGRNLDLIVRVGGDPMDLAAAVRNEVWAIDDDLPVNDLRPLSAYVTDDMAETRFTLMLMTAFGGLALLLATVGVYGVISYGVNQRSYEFGIRLALGANPHGLVRSIMLGGVRLIIVSVVVGTIAALLLARSIEGMLFEVRAADPLTYAAVATVLASVALLACYVPARRTAGADPVATLRTG